MKAFLNILYMCGTQLNNYVDILEWIVNDRKVLCRLKVEGGGKVRDFHAHSLEIHTVPGRTFPDENIDAASCY